VKKKWQTKQDRMQPQPQPWLKAADKSVTTTAKLTVAIEKSVATTDKPVPLETMICNGVECISGVLVVQDVVQNPEMQSRKALHGERLFMPDKSDITAHTTWST
jgi:hypothetical protein